MTPWDAVRTSLVGTLAGALAIGDGDAWQERWPFVLATGGAFAVFAYITAGGFNGWPWRRRAR